MTKRTRPINDIGIGFAGVDKEHIRDIRVYPEGCRVQIWVEMYGREALQYLSPLEAMEFAKAFERGAIQAFKESAE